MARATPAVLAYTAGIIDGEGCISIGRQRRRDRSPNRSHETVYGLTVIVVSKDKALPDWLYGQFGGYRGTTVRKQGWSPGVFHRWMIGANRAAELLKDVLPYLILKAEQARVAIMFQIVSRKSRGRPVLTEHSTVDDRYGSYYQRLKDLKRLPVPLETNPEGTPAMA